VFFAYDCTFMLQGIHNYYIKYIAKIFRGIYFGVPLSLMQEGGLVFFFVLP